MLKVLHNSFSSETVYHNSFINFLSCFEFFEFFLNSLFEFITFSIFEFLFMCNLRNISYKVWVLCKRKRNKFDFKLDWTGFQSGGAMEY